MSWAKRIIELEILGETIGRELRAEEAPLRTPRVEPIPYPYAYREVPAGETVTVYELRVPKGRVAYLQRVANNYYEGIKHYWEVDGKPVYDPYFELSLAPVDNPKQIVPWMRVREFTRWRCRNDSSVSRTIEILLDGILVVEEDVSILLKMGLPISE